MGIADSVPTLSRMKYFLLLVVIAIPTVVVLRYRVGARRDRTEVMARLTAERQQFGIVSPTAELFREVGVPVPDELRAGLVGDVAPLSPPSPLTPPSTPGTPE